MQSEWFHSNGIEAVKIGEKVLRSEQGVVSIEIGGVTGYQLPASTLENAASRVPIGFFRIRVACYRYSHLRNYLIVVL